MNINPFTFFVLIAVAIALLGPVSMIASHIARAKHYQAIEDERKEKLEIMRKNSERIAQLHEAKIAKENNAVVLQDAKIALLNLQILEKERNLGLNAEKFDPTDYSS